MKKLPCLFLAAALILGAGPASAACGLSDTIDVTRLAGRPPAYAADALAGSARVLPGPRTPPRDQIRASLNIAMIGGQQDLLAYRDARGWRVDRRVLQGPRMSPDGSVPTATATHGRLSRTQAARLETLLRAACLWRFPPYLPNTLPLKGGQDVTCMDGANLAIEVRSGRRRWVGAQECQIQGTPGDIYNLLSQTPGL